MISDRLKSMWRGQRDSGAATPLQPSGTQSAVPVRRQPPPQTSTRQSRGLEEFFAYIRGQSGLTLLDLGGATQQNISFITDLGHRIYSENFLQILTETFSVEGPSDQSNPGRIDYFLRQALEYPEAHFDGVLVWDVLEYLEPALLTSVVDRLRKIVRSKSYMLAFFHADNKLEAVPSYTFRIQEVNMLHVTSQGARQPVQLFNNRSLEKLFGGFESVKFFLTRDRLREVIVKV